MMSKYLYFIAQAKKINAQNDLTSHEIALLDLSAKRYFSNEVVTVGGLIRQAEIASQATLHAALKVLIFKKYLATKSSKEDGRVKELVLTKLALKRYKQLDLAIKGVSSNS